MYYRILDEHDVFYSVVSIVNQPTIITTKNVYEAAVYTDVDVLKQITYLKARGAGILEPVAVNQTSEEKTKLKRRRRYEQEKNRKLRHGGA